MKPDKRVCLYCGKEITGKKQYCDDAHRMAYKRTQTEQQTEQNVNPNTNKPEHLEPEQPQTEQVEQKDDFRSTLTKTDKTFYDRAMKAFGEPYYNFTEPIHEQTCLFCGAKFKTQLKMARFCSYDHYKAPWKSLVGA